MTFYEIIVFVRHKTKVRNLILVYILSNSVFKAMAILSTIFLERSVE